MTSPDTNNPNDARLWLRVSRGRADSSADPPTPDANELAAYVDGRLDDQARAHVEAHLARHASARQGLAEIRTVLAEPATMAPPGVLASAKALVTGNPGRLARAWTWLGGASPARSRWRVALQAASGLAAAVLIAWAGYFAGAGTYRSRQKTEEVLVTEVSFDLAGETGDPLLAHDDLDMLLALNEDANGGCAMMKRLPWILLGISIIFNFTFAGGFLHARSEAIDAETPASRPQAVAEAFGLSETQSQKYQALRDSARTRAQELRDAIYLARQELWAALAEPKRDQDKAKVKEIQARLAGLHGDYRELAAEYLGEFLQTLNPPQRQAVLSKIRSRERHRPDGNKFWKRFDTDGDGKLNETERRRAHEDMKRHHTRPRHPSEGGPGRSRPPRGPKGPSSSPAGAKPSARPGAAFQDYLRKRFDANGDGTLSDQERAEARRALSTYRPGGGRKGPWDQLPPPVRKRFDTDGDGVLSEQEKNAAAESMGRMFRGPGGPGGPGQPPRRPRRNGAKPTE